MEHSQTLLSVVIVGKNEGERLARCLESVQRMRFPPGPREVIYVDCGSSDDSLAHAEKYHAKIININADHISEGFARNAGWKEARGEFIFFLNKNSVVDPEFACKAVSEFAVPMVGVVFGNVRELYPDKSLYHRVLELDWEVPIGWVESCGDNVIIRKSILEEVEGYDETVIAGHASEMVRRIRGRGYKIKHIDIPMALENLNITTLSQYWKRCMHAGYGYAEVAERSQKNGDTFWIAETRKSYAKGATLLKVLIAALAGSILLQSFLPLYFIGVIVCFMVGAKAWEIHSTKGISWSTALLYGFHAYFQHLPMLLGQFFHFMRW